MDESIVGLLTLEIYPSATYALGLVRGLTRFCAGIVDAVASGKSARPEIVVVVQRIVAELQEWTAKSKHLTESDWRKLNYSAEWRSHLDEIVLSPLVAILGTSSQRVLYAMCRPPYKQLRGSVLPTLSLEWSLEAGITSRNVFQHCIDEGAQAILQTVGGDRGGTYAHRCSWMVLSLFLGSWSSMWNVAASVLVLNGYSSACKYEAAAAMIAEVKRSLQSSEVDRRALGNALDEMTSEDVQHLLSSDDALDVYRIQAESKTDPEVTNSLFREVFMSEGRSVTMLPLSLQRFHLHKRLRRRRTVVVVDGVKDLHAIHLLVQALVQPLEASGCFGTAEEKELLTRIPNLRKMPLSSLDNSLVSSALTSGSSSQKSLSAAASANMRPGFSIVIIGDMCKWDPTFLSMAFDSSGAKGGGKNSKLSGVKVTNVFVPSVDSQRVNALNRVDRPLFEKFGYKNILVQEYMEALASAWPQWKARDGSAASTQPFAEIAPAVSVSSSPEFGAAVSPQLDGMDSSGESCTSQTGLVVSAGTRGTGWSAAVGMPAADVHDPIVLHMAHSDEFQDMFDNRYQQIKAILKYAVVNQTAFVTDDPGCSAIMTTLECLWKIVPTHVRMVWLSVWMCVDRMDIDMILQLCNGLVSIFKEYATNPHSPESQMLPGHAVTLDEFGIAQMMSADVDPIPDMETFELGDIAPHVYRGIEECLRLRILTIDAFMKDGFRVRGIVREYMAAKLKISGPPLYAKCMDAFMQWVEDFLSTWSGVADEGSFVNSIATGATSEVFDNVLRTLKVTQALPRYKKRLLVLLSSGRLCIRSLMDSSQRQQWLELAVRQLPKQIDTGRATFFRRLGAIFVELMYTAVDAGDFEKARKWCDEFATIELFMKSAANEADAIDVDEPYLTPRRLSAEMRMSKAEMCRQRKEWDEAVTLVSESIALCEEEYVMSELGTHPSIMMFAVALAFVYSESKRYQDMVSFVETWISRSQEHFGRNNVQRTRLLQVVGDYLYDFERFPSDAASDSPSQLSHMTSANLLYRQLWTSLSAFTPLYTPSLLHCFVRLLCTQLFLVHCAPDTVQPLRMFGVDAVTDESISLCVHSMQRVLQNTSGLMPEYGDFSYQVARIGIRIRHYLSSASSDNEQALSILDSRSRLCTWQCVERYASEAMRVYLFWNRRANNAMVRRARFVLETAQNQLRRVEFLTPEDASRNTLFTRVGEEIPASSLRAPLGGVGSDDVHVSIPQHEEVLSDDSPSIGAHRTLIRDPTDRHEKALPGSISSSFRKTFGKAIDSFRGLSTGSRSPPMTRLDDDL